MNSYFLSERRPPHSAHCLAFLSAFFSAICCGAATLAQPSLHTRHAIIANAQLVDLDSQGQWVFNVGGQPTTMNASDIVRWGAWSGLLQQPAVWLRDGSWLAGRLNFSSPEEITVYSDWFHPIKIPLRQVRGIVFAVPASINAWNRLQSKLEATAGGRDAIWLSGNRQIAGVLRIELEESAPNPRYLLENAGQTIAVESTEVHAIAFSPTLFDPLPIQSKQSVLALKDGSRLNIRMIADDAACARIELVDRVVLKSLDSRSEFCRGIRCLSGQPLQVTFLADVEPTSYKYVAQSQLTWPLGKNRDLLGQPLMTVDGIVDRGLALHSSSQVAYRLDGADKEFLAEVTLAKPPDAADQRLGSAACQVMVARGGKLEQVAAFNLDRKQSSPKAVAVDLTGAQLLVMITDQADFAQYGDHVLWLEARISRGNP